MMVRHWSEKTAYELPGAAQRPLDLTNIPVHLVGFVADRQTQAAVATDSFAD
jgi:hypothetical protein